ncbi:hypothetical protein MO867_21265 [Microbulbifer sp. OS29]|uniref:YcxB-like protein n=1 Tax=Microbulbifer okhotskensis TaxID=2926617 RepID=A0A9X2EVT6_9GAMM|nr:hypothetical protein [Microbulbifer okhotskensis]MCO1336861.1 hypothetical protein [Microbulbifer okhotskensis]
MKFPYRLRVCLHAASSLAFAILMFVVAEDGGGDGALWVGVFFLFCFIGFLFSPLLERWHENRAELKKEFVEFDRERVRRVVPGKFEEQIQWSEVNEIIINTINLGPYAEDIYWMFVSRDKGKEVAVSNDARGFSELLDKLQSLPSFDNEAVIRAMGYGEVGSFIIWKAD